MRRKLIYFEKLEQLFGKSLVGKTRAKKGDYSTPLVTVKR